MQAETCSRLRWWAIGLAVTCFWLDFNLRELPRPQTVGYDWRRTADGWEEEPSWQAPPVELLPKPLFVAGAICVTAAAALSLRPLIAQKHSRMVPAGESAAE